MKCLIVISVDLPHPDEIITVMKHIDAPKIPYFAGAVRVVVGDDVDEVIEFLDESDTPKMEKK